MEVKTYETKVEAVKKYSFPFVVLDDQGNEHPAILADDDDLVAHLEGLGFGSPSEEIDARAKARQHQHPELSYRQCVDHVMAANPQLTHLYASESAGRVRVYSNEDGGSRDDPSKKLDRKARVLVASGVCKDYAEGVRQAMRDNPALGDQYARFTTAVRTGS